jgi:hypothetical protein
MKTLEQTSKPAVLKRTDRKIIGMGMAGGKREKRAGITTPALRCIFAALCIIQQINE